MENKLAINDEEKTLMASFYENGDDENELCWEPDDEFEDDSMDEEDEAIEEEDVGNLVNTNNDVPYDLIMPSGEKGLAFHDVVGHESQKKELLSVLRWFSQCEEYEKRGVSIPHGVVLIGKPGNGKTLMIREMIRLCSVPALLFKAGSGDIVKAINDTFEKARTFDKAIIVIDELDLLIDRNKMIARALQENIDGVESHGRVLVLAAANGRLDSLPPALLRHGRLEKHIVIPEPTGEEALLLLKKNFANLDMKLPEDFDEEEAKLSLNGLSCAGVKTIVNDIALRNGFDGITSEMIDQSIAETIHQAKGPKRATNLAVAMHEAGHAIMANAFPQFFEINHLNIVNQSGEFTAKEVEEDHWSYQKALADIQISMAGVLSEKLMMGEGSMGCGSDLTKARLLATKLIGFSAYDSCSVVFPTFRDHGSPFKEKNMERKIEALLRKCERKTKRYLRHHRDEIARLGQLLYEKKRLKSSQIKACINPPNCKKNEGLHKPIQVGMPSLASMNH